MILPTFSLSISPPLFIFTSFLSLESIYSIVIITFSFPLNLLYPLNCNILTLSYPSLLTVSFFKITKTFTTWLTVIIHHELQMDTWHYSSLPLPFLSFWIKILRVVLFLLSPWICLSHPSFLLMLTCSLMISIHMVLSKQNPENGKIFIFSPLNLPS